MKQRIHSLRAVTVVLLAFLAPCVALPQTKPAQIRAYESGVHIDTLPLSNGLTIRYAISIPKNYSPSTPVPLILALHYGGAPNGAAQGVLLTLVQPALADVGAIIVAPESLGGAWSAAQNERGVNALLDAVQAT
jgi:hypothetical protein